MNEINKEERMHSIRDDLVIEECNKRGVVMAFTGMRLFHH